MILTSTAISDGLLCLTTTVSAVLLWRGSRRSAAICLAVIAAAALLGTLRFAGVAEVVSGHEALSHLAAVAALPVFCLVYWRSLDRGRMTSVVLAILLIAALYVIARWVTWPPYATVIGAVGLLFALWGSIAPRQAAAMVPGVSAVVLYAVAGLVIGTVGTWHGWPRVDLYHYAIALANPLFALALRQGPRST
jgi:hypothetical protein